MKILALEREVPGVTEETFTPYLEEEAARVWELYRAGTFRELYFRQDESSAVLILECADIEEAFSFLDTLPLVRERLITFDVIPLVPYPGFARLFTDIFLPRVLEVRSEPEMELAYLQTFDNPAAAFFAVYTAQRPLRPGYEMRRRFYWLHTYLIHVWLFGDPHYCDAAARLAAEIVRER